MRFAHSHSEIEKLWHLQLKRASRQWADRSSPTVGGVDPEEKLSSERIFIILPSAASESRRPASSPSVSTAYAVLSLLHVHTPGSPDGDRDDEAKVPSVKRCA